MEGNTGIQPQAQHIEVFTIDEASEPSNNWRKLAVIEAIFIIVLGKPCKEKTGNILVFYQYGFFFGYFLEGGGHYWEKRFIHFLHVLEHVDHFKAINVFSSGKKTEIYWSGGTPPPSPL